MIVVKMIEVEKKIIIDEEQLKKIEKRGILVETKILADTYLDTVDFRFTTSDIWLRERNCQFELKVGMKGIEGSIDRYREIKEEPEILKMLGFEKQHRLKEALKEAGMIPFASFQTIRRKYRIEKFCLDLDLAYFENFVYRIAEVELEVQNSDQVPQAEKDLQEFIQTLELTNHSPARPKLIEYLFQRKPSHYQALLRAGIVKT